jgi:hypothetical protein
MVQLDSMRIPEFASEKASLPNLELLGEGLPPKALVLDGSYRKRGRELKSADALKLSERGIRRILLTPSTARALNPSQFRELLTVYQDVFLMHPGDLAPEAFLHVYGRRANGVDTRLLVASVVEWGPG